jgi:hypothetical protein
MIHRDIEESLAAEGALACFSNSFYSLRLNADRASQLKAIVGWDVSSY